MKLEDFLKQFEGLNPKATEIKFRNIKHNGDPVITNSLIIKTSAYIRKKEVPKYAIDEWNWEETEEFDFKVLILG